MQKCRLPGVGKRRVRHPESGMPAVRRSDAAEHEAFAAASEQSESAGKKLKPGLRQVPPEAPLPAVFLSACRTCRGFLAPGPALSDNKIRPVRKERALS